MHDNLSLRRIRTLFSKQISLAMIDIFPHNFSIEFLPVNCSPRLKSDSIFFYIIYCGKHWSSITNVNVFRIPFVFDALTSGTIKLNTQSLIRWATEYEGDSELGRKRIKEECCCWQSSDFCTQHYTSMLYERCTMYVYIIRNFKLKNKKRSKISFPYRMLSAHNSSRLEIQYNRLNSTPIKYRFFDRLDTDSGYDFNFCSWYSYGARPPYTFRLLSFLHYFLTRSTKALRHDVPLEFAVNVFDDLS